MDLNRLRKMTQALLVSVILNIALLGVLFYWLVREMPPAANLEIKSTGQEKYEGVVADHTNAEIIRAYRGLTIEQLTAKLSDVQPLENGYTHRDLALAALVAFHHFDLARALQGQSLSLQQRAIPYGKNRDGAILEVIAFPGLTDSHFQLISKFVSTEKWPLTSQGLFLLLQKQGSEGDASLLDAFVLTTEFTQIEALFKHSEKNVDRKQLLAMLLQGEWQQLAPFSEQMHLTQDLIPGRRQQLLLEYVKHGSGLAANLLISLEGQFAIRKLDDAQIAMLLKLLTKTSEAERFAQAVLISPRSDAVWQMAAERLYEFAGEKKPEKNVHHQAIVRFIPQMAPKVTQKQVVAKINSKKEIPSTKKEIKKVIAEQPKSPPKANKSPAAPRPKVYIVAHGDSLWKIAKRFKVSIAEIKKRNGLKSDDLAPGSSLIIP